MSCGAAAAPRIPASDDTVLDHVPAAAETRSLEPLRTRLAAHPRDEKSALALAHGYLDIGRANADPRFVSYAQATLGPWLAAARPSAAVLTLGGTVLQYLHHFDAALDLLDRALAVEPLEGQAWLTKATILQVQGRFDEARLACRPLIRASSQLVALTCLTSVNSLSGRLNESYAALRGALPQDPHMPANLRAWMEGELADMAQRAANERDAEFYLHDALSVAPHDPSLMAAYSDLLLRQHRDPEVVQFLKGREQQDNLLLRLAIAGAHLRSPAAPAWGNLFQERYEAARRDGDFTHLREQARFLLEVRGRPAEALALAQRNWQVQREPADVHVYIDAAVALGDRKRAQPVFDWIRRTHYEDRTLVGKPVAGYSVVSR
ncbi:MAG: tetratricopeptide repeat protein [Steroidobacteraceae bacterium]